MGELTDANMLMKHPIAAILLTVAATGAALAPPLPTLKNINASRVTAIGFANAADFAQQLHIAYSSMVTGSCLFAAQPFHCAASHFSQDSLEPWTPWTRVPSCDGCNKGTRMPFDHCLKSPHVVDVGSLVDYPRRQCGQNPISVPECFDAVEFFYPARVFVFRGTKDEVYQPGVVENTVALLGQLIRDPAETFKFVNSEPFAHVLPVNSTPHDGGSVPAGYDGPGECLSHLYDSSALAATDTHNSSWARFDQTNLTEAGVGFQNEGWLYVPERCEHSDCGLMVLAGKCDPESGPADDSVNQFARYAEGSGLVLLHPCVGGSVDASTYKHAKDIADGNLDTYGQLSADYVQQSAPHMRGVGNMIKRVMGLPIVPPSLKRAPHIGDVKSLKSFASTNPSESRLATPGRLPTLLIDNTSVMIAGCSNTADFSHQFHVAFSSMVTGSCIFSGQPFRCATTRFKNDFLVPKTAGTSAGMQCVGCPDNSTLLYDHCKNHPQWVDVDVLAHTAESTDGVDNPKEHLAGARVFSFAGTHDRCYQKGSMEIIADFHKRYAADGSQIKLVVDQPFPHTLPTNQTPYYNHSNPAGYDGPGECLRHVFGHKTPIAPAVSSDSSLNQNYWHAFDQMEFFSGFSPISHGMSPGGWYFAPPACKSQMCKLLVLPGGCFAPFSGNDFNHSGSVNDAFTRYAVVNNIVVLRTCSGAPIDVFKWPDNHENRRGLVDVYGQMGADYATQKGGQMQVIGKMVKRLLGI